MNCATVCCYLFVLVVCVAGRLRRWSFASLVVCVAGRLRRWSSALGRCVVPLVVLRLVIALVAGHVTKIPRRADVHAFAGAARRSIFPGIHQTATSPPRRQE